MNTLIWTFWLVDNPGNQKVFDISKLQSLLRRSLQDKQDVTFATIEREEFPYIFRDEQLLHKEAKWLRKEYPGNVKLALADIYSDYVKEYQRLVELSWNTYPMSLNKEGIFYIPFIQIDMVYLPENFLQAAKNSTPQALKAVLKPFIFEIESSIAYYELLSSIGSNNTSERNWFANWLQKQLDQVRQDTGKKVSLLVTSQSKYQSVKELEFGVAALAPLVDQRVREKSWFDSLIWPDEFIDYFRMKLSDTLFYVRASSDANELKSPNNEATKNILEDEEYRNFIRQNSITTNIDNPNTPFPINDTKKYMKNMGLWFFFNSVDSIISEEALDYIQRWKDFSKFTGKLYTQELEQYLLAIWVDVDTIKKGELTFRCKPVEWSYGAYGHVRLRIQDAKSRKKLREAMLSRWQYILQVEHQAPLILNTSNRKLYKWIDRIFMSMDREWNIKFMQWFINIIPADNDEAKKNNIHWSRLTEYWIIY